MGQGNEFSYETIADDIRSAGPLVVLFSGCACSPQAKRDRYFSRGRLLEKKDYGRAILPRNASKVISTDPESITKWVAFWPKITPTESMP
jgi:hypothetical protein